MVTTKQVAELIGRYKERALIQAAIEGKWRRKWDKLFEDQREQVEQIQRALKSTLYRPVLSGRGWYW